MTEVFTQLLEEILDKNKQEFISNDITKLKSIDVLEYVKSKGYDVEKEIR